MTSPPPDLPRLGSFSAEGGERWANGGAKQQTLNISEKELEAKERMLMESIQRNYGRIRDVEKELSDLQVQLRVNVGPKKHALEHMRRKIEVQAERVTAARAAAAAAAKVAAAAAEALAAEEASKEQLCQELNLLVQQSARGQLDKLEQLTQRLEALNSGLAVGEAPAAALQRASELQQNAEALRGAILATSHPGDAPAAHPSRDPPPPPYEAVVGAQAQAQQQGGGAGDRSAAYAEAEAARAKHVQLNRPASQGKSSNRLPAAAARPATRDANGAFRGFE